MLFGYFMPKTRLRPPRSMELRPDPTGEVTLLPKPLVLGKGLAAPFQKFYREGAIAKLPLPEFWDVG